MYASQSQSSFVGLAIGCIVVITFCPAESIAADWKERLLSEAPPKWTALERYYSKMEASYRSIVATPPEGKSFPLTFQGTVYNDTRQNGGIMLCTQHRVGKDSNGKRQESTRVLGVNSRYAFSLGKTSPESDTFVLTNFEPANDKSRQKVHGSGGGEYDFAYKVQAIRLIDLIRDPRFTFDVRGVQQNGKEMVQLEYDHKQGNLDGKAPPQTKASEFEHGIVLLDPEHFWRKQEYHINNTNWKIDGYLEYGDEVDGFPILRRCKHTATHKQFGTMLLIFEFDKLIHRDIPESEFTLSAFGLPEVQVPSEQKPRSLWRWLIGIGIAFGVVAVLLRLYVQTKRRYASKQI